MSTGFVTLFEKGNLELHNDAEHEALRQLADKNCQFQRNISEDVPLENSHLINRLCLYVVLVTGIARLSLYGLVFMQILT